MKKPLLALACLLILAVVGWAQNPGSVYDKQDLSDQSAGNQVLVVF